MLHPRPIASRNSTDKSCRDHDATPATISDLGRQPGLRRHPTDRQRSMTAHRQRRLDYRRRVRRTVGRSIRWPVSSRATRTVCTPSGSGMRPRPSANRSSSSPQQRATCGSEKRRELSAGCGPHPVRGGPHGAFIGAQPLRPAPLSLVHPVIVPGRPGRGPCRGRPVFSSAAGLEYPPGVGRSRAARAEKPRDGPASGGVGLSARSFARPVSTSTVATRSPPATAASGRPGCRASQAMPAARAVAG